MKKKLACCLKTKNIKGPLNPKTKKRWPKKMYKNVHTEKRDNCDPTPFVKVFATTSTWQTLDRTCPGFVMCALCRCDKWLFFLAFGRMLVADQWARWLFATCLIHYRRKWSPLAENTSIGAIGHSLFVLGSLLTTALQNWVCPVQSHRIVSALLNKYFAKPYWHKWDKTGRTKYESEIIKQYEWVAWQKACVARMRRLLHLDRLCLSII